MNKNNFSKILKIFVLMVFILPCFLLIFSGCNFLSGVTIKDIKKTSTNDYMDTYTIYYTDGTTSTFTVKNGADGQDAESLTITQIYNECVEKGYTGSFNDFLKEYLSFDDVDTKTIAINQSLLSSVSIYSQFQMIYDEPYYNTWGYYMGSTKTKTTELSAGSGVIYNLDKENGDAYIITNYHVVYNVDSENQDGIGVIHAFLYGSSLEVYRKVDNSGNYILDSEGYQDIYYGDDAISCEYIGGSMTYDIAVLKVSNSNIIKNSDARRVNIASCYTVGETAIAIGNPEAEGFSITEGVVSVESEYFTMLGADNETEITFRTIRVDTPINSGNSGGGLFNKNGELIGIVNAKIVDSEIENMGYAIPRDIVVNVAENIIYNYENTTFRGVNKITVGLSLEIQDSYSVFNVSTQKTEIIEKSMIIAVSNNSLASVVGFEVNDYIQSIEINGVVYKTTRQYQIIDLALNIRIGDSVTYHVLRNGVNTNVSFVATSEYFSKVK